MRAFAHWRSHLVLVTSTIFYAVCIIPGNIILRIARRDPMQGKPDPARTSYWKKRDEHGTSKPMKYPF